MIRRGNTSAARPWDIEQGIQTMTSIGDAQTVLEARGVCKSFGAHLALDHVDFALFAVL